MPEKLYLGADPFLNNGVTLGNGGQAVVVKYGGWAVKVLKTIDSGQTQKIQYLLRNQPNLPDRFLFPKIPLSTRPNGGGELRGYGMVEMPSSFREMGVLFNRTLRTTLRIFTPTMVEMLKLVGQDISTIHSKNIILGDVSGRNASFVFSKRGIDVFWYDTDAWQLAGANCPVWTEYFLCPELYGQAGSGKVKFTEQSDWYGYWTMLFWSLFNIHQYSQVHPKYLDFRERAVNGIWYLNKDIPQTSLANHPDSVSDDLLDKFASVFGKHRYEEIQIKMLDDYLASLTECSSCGLFYPNTRKVCPKCTYKTPVVNFQPTYLYESLIKTNGEIVFARFQSGNLYVVSREKSGYYLTIRPGNGKPVKVFVDVDLNFSYRFEMVGDEYLAVNQIDTEMIYLTHISVPGESWITSSSETFLGNRQTVFRGTALGLLRQSGSKLLLGNVSNGRMLEKVLPATVSKQETWIWADTSGSKILTLSRLFNKYHFQLIYKERRFSLKQRDLNDGDSLRETLVLFGTETVCLRRVVNRNGKMTVLTEIFDLFGQSVFESTHLLAKMPAAEVHRTAYEDGEMYWQTDSGLVVEDIAKNTFSLVPKTEKLIEANDKLVHLGGRKHFLVIREKQVNYLVI